MNKGTKNIFLFQNKMDLIAPSKQVIPVSVWARQLHTEEDPRCLVVMEPVERITGTVKFDFSVSIFIYFNHLKELMHFCLALNI